MGKIIICIRLVEEKQGGRSVADQENKGIGEVKIASDVVAAIAALAATEVDGVYAMAGNVTNELISRLGKRKLSKGVKVQMESGVVHVDMMVNVRYGYNIPKVSEQVQDRVSQQIETMTGLVVSEVNVRVAGVNLGSE
ncbi:MAG: Asp23/Gls24 family envelope stress response protein [Lachnospiraceae bacterium]|nr:Asp23/Gls24 family envelope stress response protein [Lachnospiraceae bacterium]